MTKENKSDMGEYTLIRKDPPRPDVGRSVQWFSNKDNQILYKDKWVAIQNGVLIASDYTRAGLLSQLDGIDRSTLVIHLVGSYAEY